MRNKNRPFNPIRVASSILFGVWFVVSAVVRKTEREADGERGQGKESKRNEENPSFYRFAWDLRPLGIFDSLFFGILDSMLGAFPFHFVA